MKKKFTRVPFVKLFESKKHGQLMMFMVLLPTKPDPVRVEFHGTDKKGKSFSQVWFFSRRAAFLPAARRLFRSATLKALEQQATNIMMEGQ